MHNCATQVFVKVAHEHERQVAADWTPYMFSLFYIRLRGKYT